jgi:uncharacterized protein YdcH (DUF465 family)
MEKTAEHWPSWQPLRGKNTRILKETIGSPVAISEPTSTVRLCPCRHGKNLPPEPAGLRVMVCNSRVAVSFHVCYGSDQSDPEVILNPQKEDVMMKEEEIKEHLMSSSADFRRLAEEHHQQEKKLQELLSHPHLSEQDRLVEITLKKKKLQLKDQMNSLVLKFRNELSHQPT